MFGDVDCRSLGLGCGLSQQIAPISAQRQPSRAQHSPDEEYVALVYCLDTSKSPLPDEFNKLKRLVGESITTGVDFNDLIWIVRIEDQFHTPKMFPMPPHGYRRSERQRSTDQLREAKEEIIREVEGLQQISSKTDLKNAIELALNILRDQPAAKRRLLIIMSDFVQDSGKRITAAPPEPTKGLSAKDIEVALLLLYPGNKYLTSLGLSASEHHNSVTEQWTPYFNELGATTTIVRLADAVPAAQKREVTDP
jgi:hypothetical protein